MKKCLLWLLLVLCAILLFTACAGNSQQNNEGETKPKLTISTQSDPFGFLEDVVKGFQKIHPEADIQLTNYRGDYENTGIRQARN
ncbi:MAG: hypothetical protein FWG61_00575 [Firmicutes bacterium]|nr:hypothetical protein [Bacillota bacterium]